MSRWIAARLSRNEEGFTLIELLVVVAIIALLTTFALPKIYNAVSSAKRVPGQSDLATISGSLDRYFYENDAYPGVTGAMVDEAGFKAAMNSYIRKATPMKNGYDKGYMYISDDTGSFFILVDPENTAPTAGLANDITVTCSGVTEGVELGVDGAMVVHEATVLVTDDVAGGCTTDHGSIVTN